MSIPTPASAQSNALGPVLPAPIPRARWSEDWSILQYTPQPQESFTGRFKSVELNADGSNYVSFGGEYRATYEIYDPADFDLSTTGRWRRPIGRNIAITRESGASDWIV